MARKTSVTGSAQYSRAYKSIRGISSASEGDMSRFGFAENMYVDYEGGADAVESIPGFRRLCSTSGRINGLFLQRVSPGEEYMIVHSGVNVYRFRKSDLSASPTLSRIAELNDTKSSSFCFGYEIYIMDGEHILRISREGVGELLGAGECLPYIPTVYLNGKKHEERNLLSSKAKECYVIDNTERYIYGSPELTYMITDEKSRLCTVLGGDIRGEVHIPTSVIIDEKRYKVTEIAENAFKNNKRITALYTNPGIIKIGDGAFYGCSALRSAEIAYTAESIGTECFFVCSSLTHLILDYFPLEVGKRAFNGCSSLTTVQCSGSIDGFAEHMAGTGLETKTPKMIPRNTSVTLGLPICGNILSIDGIENISASTSWDYDSERKILRIYFSDEEEFKGKELLIDVTLSPNDSVLENYILNTMGAVPSEMDPIRGCRICECFGGRIFLSGHPLLPGAVFFSERDSRSAMQPLYFGEESFFIDGAASDHVSALLADHDRLIVFKSGSSGTGTVFFHREKDISTGTEYPVEYVHGSVPVLGGAASFLGETVFLTAMGLCALEKAPSSEYREVKCRSASISKLLTLEDLSGASVTEWMGYLVVAAGQRLYLADSRGTYKRNGVLQYEWYRLSGIGTYKNDRRVYRYSARSESGCELSDTPDEPVYGEVFSEGTATGSIYYVTENGRRISVYPTEEYSGGEFDPCCTVLGDGRLLFFGTLGGDICVFNNDKRGVAPSRIKYSPGFSEEGYRAAMGNRIHSDFYSFDRHRVRYSLETVLDDCDLPSLSKSTVRDSLVIKFKCFESSRASVRAVTELGDGTGRWELPLSVISFDDIDFSTLSFIPSELSGVQIPEYEKGWTEKKYLIEAEGVNTPFGVSSLSYRYTIRGKTK